MKHFFFMVAFRSKNNSSFFFLHCPLKRGRTYFAQDVPKLEVPT